MKQLFAFICAITLAVTLFAGVALATDTSVIDSTDTAELFPVDVITSVNRLEIRKIYELSPDVDSGRIPRDSFTRSDYQYELVDVLREVIIGEEFKTVSVTEAAESSTNDLDTILSLFPQNLEYTDDDGFAGRLLLNTASIRYEISGYGRRTTPFTVTRNFPNMASMDTQHIPRSIDDNGQTLQLQDVQWRNDNTQNMDGYAIGDRFTALATYGGSRTTTYVLGYDLTAEYIGEVVRRDAAIIRYTAIFLGTEIPPVVEETPPPPPPEPEPEEIPEAEAPQRNIGGWIAPLISVLALLGCGTCIYLLTKKRKERPTYEETDSYNYNDSDNYIDDDVDDVDFDGNGDREN